MSATYAEQIEVYEARLRAATGMTHSQHITALELLVAGQLLKAESLLISYGLPIPHSERMPRPETSLQSQKR